jgi:O-antigen/teichoic acid export membrane protein
MIKLPSLAKTTLRSVAALSGAALLTQATSLLSAPVLSRIYSTQHYGTIAALASLIGPMTTFAGLMLAPAIVVTPDEDDVDALLYLHALAAFMMSLVTALAVVTAGNLVQQYVHIEVGNILLLAVLSAAWVLLAALSESVSALVNRQKAYGVLALSRLVSSISGTMVTIGVGFYRASWWGLAFGMLVSFVVQLGVCGWSARARMRQAYATGSAARSLRLLRSYRRYPLFVLPTTLVNTLLGQAPVYALGAFSTSGALGAYSMGQRMLALPAGLLSTSVGEVFTRGAAERYAANGECRTLFSAVMRSLVFVAIPMFTAIAIAGPDIFAWFLGEKWRLAGEYVRVLAPLMALRFVASPLSYMYVVANHQREDMFLHIGTLVIVAIVAAVAGSLSSSGTVIIASLSSVMLVFYGIFLFRSWQFSAGRGEPRDRGQSDGDAFAGP